MDNLNAVIDYGSQNLKLGIFNQDKKSVYFSKKKINISLEESLNTLIRDAEINLSTHIDNIIVLYDSANYHSLDISIKKVFDQSTSIKPVYDNLIEEAHFLISQNNFKDKIIHLVIKNIFVDENKKLYKIIGDIKINYLILEIKFICLKKTLIDDIKNTFKKNNLNVLNIFCSSYIKSISYKKKSRSNNPLIFLDVGYERTSSLVFNNGIFEFFKSIPLGGNHISKDIAKVLNISFEYSEDLKIKFNKLENEMYLYKDKLKEKNLISEISEKNLSTQLLRQIIEARVDEIIDLVFLKSNIIKSLNFMSKPVLIVTGGGSKFLINNYKLKINKVISEIITYDENDSLVCEVGLDYFKSKESFLVKTKKKSKKSGFFERFFNLFSK